MGCGSYIIDIMINGMYKHVHATTTGCDQIARAPSVACQGVGFTLLLFNLQVQSQKPSGYDSSGKLQFRHDCVPSGPAASLTWPTHAKLAWSLPDLALTAVDYSRFWVSVHYARQQCRPVKGGVSLPCSYVNRHTCYTCSATRQIYSPPVGLFVQPENPFSRGFGSTQSEGNMDVLVTVPSLFLAG